MRPTIPSAESVVLREIFHALRFPTRNSVRLAKPEGARHVVAEMVENELQLRDPGPYVPFLSSSWPFSTFTSWGSLKNGKISYLAPSFRRLREGVP